MVSMNTVKIFKVRDLPVLAHILYSFHTQNPSFTEVFWYVKIFLSYFSYRGMGTIVRRGKKSKDKYRIRLTSISLWVTIPV